MFRRHAFLVLRICGGAFAITACSWLFLAYREMLAAGGLTLQSISNLSNVVLAAFIAVALLSIEERK